MVSAGVVEFTIATITIYLLNRDRTGFKQWVHSQCNAHSSINLSRRTDNIINAVIFYVVNTGALTTYVFFSSMESECLQWFQYAEW